MPETDLSSSSAASVRNILFVEENVSYFEMLRKVFSAWSREGWQFLHATTPGKALRILEDQVIDLVILDQRLTTMDGFQFLRILKLRYPAIRKAVLTAEPSEDKKVIFISAGVDVYLEKPASIDGMESVYTTLNELARWRSDAGFRGIVHGLKIKTILQMICFGGHSAVLDVTAGATTGTIFIKEGLVVHAESANHAGDMALGLLLSLANGSFELRPFGEGPLQVTTSKGWDALDGLPLPEPEPVLEKPKEVSTTLPSEQSTGGVPEAIQPVAVAPESHIDELVVCSKEGDLIFQSRSSDPASRSSLVAAVVQQSNALNQLIPVGRFDRLEVETEESRLVMHASNSALVFIQARRLQEN
jgi:two-component system response regulator (stage 0 sporulation protein F)